MSSKKKAAPKAPRQYSEPEDMSKEELAELKAEYNELKESKADPARMAELSALGKIASAAINARAKAAKAKKEEPTVVVGQDTSPKKSGKKAKAAKADAPAVNYNALRACLADMVAIMHLEDEAGNPLLIDEIEDGELAVIIMKEAAELVETDFYAETEGDDVLKEATVKTLTGLGVEIPAAPEKEEKARPAKKESKPKAEKKAPAEKKGGGIKRVGVIAAIVAMISKKAMTRAEVLEGLVAQFPDRPEKSMKNTVYCQLTRDLPKKHNVIRKDDKFKIG
jgi:hypothetical protein